MFLFINVMAMGAVTIKGFACTVYAEEEVQRYKGIVNRAGVMSEEVDKAVETFIYSLC